MSHYNWAEQTIHGTSYDQRPATADNAHARTRGLRTDHVFLRIRTIQGRPLSKLTGKNLVRGRAESI